MKILSFASLLVLGNFAFAAPTLSFNFKNADVTTVIKEYAKASGQKFIVDPNAQGTITIINKGDVNLDEAFNQMSAALAINGIGISKQGNEMIVKQARALQRDLIEVSSQLPAMHPTKMATWVISLKYISADEVNKQLRMLTSRDGELAPFTHNNQLVITDWTPNLHRVAQLIKELDVQVSKKATK
jgi:general secretion pathway protein D